MTDLDQWKLAEERILAAYACGQEPDPKDLQMRGKLEKEWELSYPIAAGHYSDEVSR